MRLFKDDDSVVDCLAKVITILGFAFGVFVYFNTIHPVFEKESELQSLRGERIKLQVENERANNNNERLKRESFKYQADNRAIKVKYQELNASVEEKEQLLKDINEKLKNAKNDAVLTNLDTIGGKIIDAYKISILSGSRAKFNALDFSDDMVKQFEQKNKPNDSEKDAYKYFSKYIESNRGKDISSQSEIIRYALLLSYTYKTKSYEAN